MQQTHQKKYFSIIVLLVMFWNLTRNAAFAQDTLLCSTPEMTQDEFEKLPWYSNNRFLFDFLDSCDYFAAKEQPNKIFYRVPIQFHIYRDDQGNGGFSLEDIKTHMNAINHYHISNRTGFLFYMYPEIIYIDKTKNLKVNYYAEAPTLSTKQFREGSVNVHVAQEINKAKKNGRKVTTTGVYNDATKTVFMSINAHKSTMAHEVGHYFGLLHPHRNANKGKCKQEAVSRTREFENCPFSSGLICEKSGDGLCDTPAEPNLAGFVNKNCRFVGAGKKDNWGDLYKPRTDNIMSYTVPRWCRDNFTLGQIAVMLYTANQKNECGWETRCYSGQKYKHQYLFDRYEPDDLKEMSNELEADFSQLHTFHLVYAGKKHKDIDVDKDWYFIDLKEDKTVLVELKNGVFLSAEIEIRLFDESGEMLESRTKKKENNIVAIELDLKAGKYYLECVKKSKVLAPDIADYEILLQYQ